MAAKEQADMTAQEQVAAAPQAHQTAVQIAQQAIDAAVI